MPALTRALGEWAEALLAPKGKLVGEAIRANAPDRAETAICWKEAKRRFIEDCQNAVSAERV